MNNPSLAWRQLFEAARKMFSDNLKQLENDLSRHTALIDRQASLEEYQSAQVARLQSQQYFEEARAAELDRRRVIVQQWLGSTTAQTRHDSHITTRHPCTGDWLFRDPRFQKWFDFDYCTDPILWLSGMPGAGMKAQLDVECSINDRRENHTGIHNHRPQP
jgi:hypothetical protein